MDAYKRHKRIYNFLQPAGYFFLSKRYGIDFEQININEPCIIVSNHVTNYDPILLSLCLLHNHTYFVASEHLLRLGFLTKLLNYFLGFIPQKKGNSALSTVKACLEQTRLGHNVTIFAEGNTTWNGESGKIFPATGKLVKKSGVSLVTFRIENAYLAAPRWRKGLKKSRMRLHPVKIYSPEELSALSPEEINRNIENDIYENVWDSFPEQSYEYTGNDLAEGLEKALFICPKCKKINSLHTAGNRISCSCGFGTEMLRSGIFSPGGPFENILQWDKWQLDHLEAEKFKDDEAAFYDDSCELYIIENDHTQRLICTGALTQYGAALSIGDKRFSLSSIDNIAIVQTNRLLFSSDGVYYEIRSQGKTCIRKYYCYISSQKERKN